MTKIALITGATSGIGEATARLFAKNNYDLILCGRRQDRLASLKNQLIATSNVFTLNFDVRKREQVHNAIKNLPDEWKNIDVLVNNAGNAHGFDPIDQGSEDDWDAMIDINVKGLLYVTKAVVPLMIERQKGHIINTGSIAGKEVYPKGNVYCASKHAVDALTKGMLLDLHMHNIKVSSVNPGMVETEFSLVRFKGDEEKAKNVYKGMDPLKASDIADIIYYIASQPAHVNISDVTVFPTSQASATVVNRKI